MVAPPRWRAMAHLSRDGAGRGSLGCSAMFRLTGSRGPGRLSSGTAAGSAVSSSHCLRSEGIFSREPGRVPGAGAGIRAGKGSVTAPGVPVRVAVGVPGALSHIFSESRGVLRVLRESCAPPGSAFGRLCVPLIPRYGAYLPGLIGPGDPGVPGALSRRSDTSDMPGRALVVGRRGSGPGSDSTRAGDGPGWSDMRPGPNRRTRAILSRRPHAGQATGSRVAAVHRRPHPEHRRRARGESVPVSSGTVIPTAPGSTRSSA